jgi:DNA-binding Xre family transcriptional regulator
MLSVVREWSWENASEAEVLGLRVIARGVRQRRLAERLSQQQLAWRTGVAQSTISRLETCRLGSMKIRTLARIVGVLDIGASFLFPDEPHTPTRRLPGMPAVSTPSGRARPRAA